MNGLSKVENDNWMAGLFSILAQKSFSKYGIFYILHAKEGSIAPFIRPSPGPLATLLLLAAASLDATHTSLTFDLKFFCNAVLLIAFKKNTCIMCLECTVNQCC